MQLIFGKNNADTLKQKYTVLDLEVLKTEDGRDLEVYCVIPAEKISLGDFPQLEQWKKLHEDFLHGYQTNQYEFCRQCIEHLMGKFGGEVDTFYQEILSRINKAEPVSE